MTEQVIEARKGGDKAVFLGSIHESTSRRVFHKNKKIFKSFKNKT
jgi:hypothetical protein